MSDKFTVDQDFLNETVDLAKKAAQHEGYLLKQQEALPGVADTLVDCRIVKSEDRDNLIKKMASDPTVLPRVLKKVASLVRAPSMGSESQEPSREEPKTAADLFEKQILG